MTDINNSTVVGRLTRDAEYKQAGNSVTCKFGIAVNKSKRVNDQWEDEVSYIDIQAWGRLAENMVGNLKKGTRVCVIGYLKQERWESNGEQKSKLILVANDIIIEAPKEQANGF